MPSHSGAVANNAGASDDDSDADRETDEEDADESRPVKRGRPAAAGPSGGKVAKFVASATATGGDT